MKKFNINDHMYIQITEEGWAYLRKSLNDTKFLKINAEEYIKHCIEPYKVEIDGEVWHRLQMHFVFDHFPIHMGGPIYFKTNVMFDDDELKNI